MNVNIFGRRESKELFKITPQGDVDVEMKRIRNVKAGIEPNDAATLAMLDNRIEHLKNAIIAQIKEKNT